MQVFEAIQRRQSIRNYDSRPIEPEKLNSVLEAARLAPSASNEQDWMFVVVTNEELRKRMVPACFNQRFVAQAPVNLVVCARNLRNMRCGQPARTIDCSIAMSFMMLEATAQGLGTCWLGDFFADQVQEILEIPKEYTVVAVAPLGYPAGRAYSPNRKPQSEVVRYNNFSKQPEG